MAAELIRDAHWIVQIPVPNLLQGCVFKFEIHDSFNLRLKQNRVDFLPTWASKSWKSSLYPWNVAMHHQFENTKNTEEPSLHYIIWHSNIQSSINDWNSQKPSNFELNIDIFSGILPRNCHDVKEFHGPGLVDHAGRKVQPGRSQKGRIHDGFMDGSRKVIFLAFFVNFDKFQLFWTEGVAKHTMHSLRKMSTVYQRLVQDFGARLLQGTFAEPIPCVGCPEIRQSRTGWGLCA